MFMFHFFHFSTTFLGTFKILMVYFHMTFTLRFQKEGFCTKILKQVEYESARRKRHINEKKILKQVEDESARRMEHFLPAP